MNVLAIDPGNTESAYIVIDGDRCPNPGRFGKVPNTKLREMLADGRNIWPMINHVAIEMVASYGMAVGAEVFETCVWIGRFAEAIRHRTNREPQLVYRKDVKLHLCLDSRAKDTNIRQALVDRFAAGQPNHGKGTKAQPGWFYGFRADVWSAYAVAVYVADNLTPTPAAVAHGHVIGDHVRVTGGEWQAVQTLDTDGEVL